MSSFKVKFVGNHWYPCLNHESGYLPFFNEKIDKYLSIIDSSKYEELTIELEELGIIVFGINIVDFNDEDIVRYLTTEDNFDMRFTINGHQFEISSDLYWLLEDTFNLNLHKTMYKIHIY